MKVFYLMLQKETSKLMNLNENIFLSYLNNLRCFENKPNIAVGVSGGPDSMALTYLLSNWVITLKERRIKY